MTIKDALQSQRRVLLDLTYRNRLLNLPKKPSARSITLHGESSRELHRLLVLDKRALSFSPLPDGELLEDLAADDAVHDDEGTVLAQPASVEDVVSRQTDLKLQTRLKSENLQKRLLEIFYESRTMLEEQGVNVLYLALGQLQFRDPKATDQLRSAPLLLLPVELERKTARERFVVKWNEEDLQENLSLREKLRVDFGIGLPDFPSTESFDVEQYFADLRELLALQEGWEVADDLVQLGFFSFSKLLMFLDLDPDRWPEESRIDQNPLISGLLGQGFSERESRFDSSESSFLDALVPAANMKYVMDCDSSQALAIEAIRRGDNLVIQGPPGTGKSQTIANVIAAAVADGKTVLFVAEKMAALEVVKRRLDNVGLAPLCLELHSNKANKKLVLDELARTLAVGRPERMDVEGTVTRLTELRDRLNKHAADLHRRDIGAAQLSAFEILGHLAKRVPVAGRPSYRLAEAASWTLQQTTARAGLIEEICKQLAVVGNPLDSVWRGVGIAPVMRPVAEDMLQAVDGLPTTALAVQEEGASLAAALGLPAAKTANGVRAQCLIATRLVSAPAFDRDAIGSAVWSAGIDALREALARGRQHALIRARRSADVVDAAWSMDWQAARLAVAAHGDSWLRWMNAEHRTAVAKVRSIAKGAPKKARADRLALLDDLIEAQACAARLQAVEAQARSAFGAVWRDASTDWDLADAVLVWAAEQAAPIEGTDVRQLAASVENRESLVEQVSSTEKALKAYAAAVESMKTLFDFDEAAAADGRSLDDADFTAQYARFSAWQGAGEDLVRWLAFVDARRRVTAAGLDVAFDAFASEPTSWAGAAGQFWVAYYLQMLEEASRVRPELPRFDGRQHDALVDEFRKVDTRRQAAAQTEVAEAHYASVPRAALGHVGTLGVLRSEIARQRNHMPLRKLLKKCASPIQAAKPVFMMSPLSIAQFLEPGCVGFDLLVIDEASQVEPVDALGAIARSQQIVVVGDDKQLPPTSFFSRIVGSDDLDDEDEGAQAKDLESILSLCVAKGLPQRMLKWHYRSRHESLIAVSNKEFYEGGLFIVPSPDRGRQALGLKFHHLPEGRFDRGNSQKNHVEAVAIAGAVVEHARSHPHLTLGVGAMSVRQRQAITDEVELARRQHPELEHFFTAHKHEPFFVKNLENIQGDERDVILISIGYGRSKSDDRMYQSFGPLNADGGHRRLNVLITRARQRCEVYSSIVADDIRIDQNSKPGLIALKTYLRYAEAGDLGIPTMTGRGADSPFEEAVQAVLSQHGFKVDNQVGVAGFFIDLAVVDPDASGRYLLGIECDGATYHSAPSARDRDRLRQEILEAHGWTIHRIWSTDWFQQQDKERVRLLEAIAIAKAGVPPREPTRAPAPLRRELPSSLFDDGEEVTRVTTTYVQASFVPGNADLQPHEVPVGSMAKTVTRIIEIEGPIHQDEIVARVRDLWKLGRAGSRIQAAVAAALTHASRGGALTVEASCYRLKDAQVVPRDRSSAESRSLKKPELLPPQEIRQGILDLAREAHGVGQAEVTTTLARMLGFAATSQQLREIIGAQLDLLLSSGRMRETDGMLEATDP